MIRGSSYCTKYARKGKTQDHSAISEELPESNQFLYQICCL
jgi:hypothetical protein